MNRRHLLMAGLCVASAGAAYAATPRHKISLVGESQFEDFVPREFGPWVSRDISDALALNNPESLSAQLYAQILSRAYSDLETGREIVVLMAYGASQTDNLQLHRPEVCYPAFGYDIVRNEGFQMPLKSGVTIPARRLAAQAKSHQESIVYWSRIGEALPLDGQQQRRERLRIAMQGIIPDGVLVRFSSRSIEAGGTWPEITKFAAALMQAMPSERRAALIGTRRAAALNGAGAA